MKSILSTISHITIVVLCFFFFFHHAGAQDLSSLNDLIDKQPVLIKKITFLKNYEIKLETSEKPSKYNTFTLSEPNRIVIDIHNAEFADKNYKPKLASYIKSYRTSVGKDKSLRIVFDLKEKLIVRKASFETGQNGVSGQLVAQFKKKKITKSHPTKYFRIAKKVIVIDAGHGGKDPGTIGRYARTKEKNITLSYAKELKKYLDSTKKYKVYLTRGKDYFIPLGERVKIARKLKADLFISLHANSIENRKISGFSIYTLSETSSDKQAEKLARKENRADILAGVNFSTTSKDIMKTLISLSQRDSMNNSAKFANMAITEAKKSKIRVLQNTHRFAGFAVLKAPDMAAVLIELGYLSNKYEERRLNSIFYKRKVAKSLVGAINKYFTQIK